MSTKDMADQQDSQSQHTAPADRTILPAIKTGRIALYFCMGLCGLVMLSNVTHLGSSSSQKLPRSIQNSKPVPADPDAITGFAQQQAADIAKLKNEAEKLMGSSSAISSIVPPCDPSLAGTHGTAPDGTPIICESDGSWRRTTTSSADSAIPGTSSGLTPEQQEAQRRKAEQERREQSALASTTLAVDFSDQNARNTEKPDPSSPNVLNLSSASQENSPPAASTDDNPAATKAPVNPTIKAKPDWFRYTGKLHRIFEGSILETVLTNRVNGSFAGPINTMLTTNVYSHDHQTLLIPQGTRCLGTVSAVNSTNQQRLFVAFHRCIMPDGYPLDLDKFPGLNQVGETALRDLVNHHYLQIFGASLAVGAIGGFAQIGNSASAFTYDPGVALRNGVSQETSQEALQILNHFLNQLPTFVIREKTRVKIYISADLEVPAYDAHVIDPEI
jgi:type IV secretory pathway VirB10-like protein